ncbi:Thioesterase/thiol ester dehydrase-isomerase [Gonapodya prolifera JEL478]|uniref:Acyl-coenzyme A thioesterase 13 n=1 Tax=Gonapodya prolifera (strain JEL478) TaxID=1344416 RepID=A0A139AC84_GONPJ|nr:Thioesterase/thiol ester dehydrase-isomerase [Gonapodya prolifera JEL478]|eukprot:KXS14269.1 Thioesterase/thiol ester dehydrase-isomerase [Gonapodya prolifera JEL478]
MPPLPKPPALEIARSYLQRLVGSGGMDSRVFPHLAVTEAIPGRVRCELVVTKEVANKHDTIHGGAIASLVDIIGSTAIATHGPNYQSHVSVDLNVSYLKAAPLNSKVHIEGTCDRLGRTLAFTTTTVKMGDDLVAVGRHTKFIMQPRAVHKESGHGESKSRHGHSGSGDGKE